MIIQLVLVVDGDLNLGLCFLNCIFCALFVELVFQPDPVCHFDLDCVFRMHCVWVYVWEREKVCVLTGSKIGKETGKRNRISDEERCFFISYLSHFILFKSFPLKITSLVMAHTTKFCNNGTVERRSLSSVYLDLFCTHDHFV